MPDPAYIEEWFRYAERDLEGARVLAGPSVDPILALRSSSRPSSAQGIPSRPRLAVGATHGLSYLLALAADHDERLEVYRELCRAATTAYMGERYAGSASADVPSSAAKSAVAEAEAMIRYLRG